MENKIAIEVVYARVGKQLLLDLEVDEGTTIEQAILQSGIIDQFPEINLDKDKVGIFGKLSKKASDEVDGIISRVKSVEKINFFLIMLAILSMMIARII